MRGERLKGVVALDSAGEEATLIVAPLAVAAIVAVAPAEVALVVAAAGLLGGRVAAGRSSLTHTLARPTPARAAPTRLSAALWLTIATLIGPEAALGAINLAVPALARAADAPARAGLLLAALAVGTAGSSLLYGRHASSCPPTDGCRSSPSRSRSRWLARPRWSSTRSCSPWRSRSPGWHSARCS